MAPSRRRPRGFNPGFTLIELLVVIAIIGDSHGDSAARL